MFILRNWISKDLLQVHIVYGTYFVDVVKYVYIMVQIFFSEIPYISPSISSHQILIIISMLCDPFSALNSFYFWQITISNQSLHDRWRVRSWEWASKSERLKGESQENGGRGVSCKLCRLFCKYFVSVIKMASLDLRVLNQYVLLEERWILWNFILNYFQILS